jgi:tripartite-type tricarboxylate transporter receptor subunit TctC
MDNLIKRIVAVAAIVVAGTTSALAADPFPTKTIRIIVHSTPGGLLDAHSRMIAQKMSEKLGQPVVIDNRAGAGGLVGIRAAKAAPADGYTLLSAASTIASAQSLFLDPGYDVVKDFSGIGGMTRSPFMLVTGGNQPGKTLADLVAQAKAKPGTVTYGSAGSGSSTHLPMALFAQQAGLDIVHVPYKGNSAVWPDLIAGRVNLLFEGVAGATPMIRDGRMKSFGVASVKRLDTLPDVPTIAEQGFPNFTAYVWFGLLAPTGTPKDVVQKLSDALRSVLGSEEVKDRLRAEGADPFVTSPVEFNQFLKNEADTMAKLITSLGIPKQ